MTKLLLSHNDLGILEVEERGGHTTISEWGVTVTPLPLRLMGSMTLLREGGTGGHTPK